MTQRYRSFALYQLRRAALMLWFACGGGLLDRRTWERTKTKEHQ